MNRIISMKDNSTLLQNHQLSTQQLAAKVLSIWGRCAHRNWSEKKKLSQESYNIISECKVFAKVFLLRLGSSISHIYSKCLKFPHSGLLIDTGFLTNNLNYQKHVSLKEPTFVHMVRYWPSNNFRLLKHTAALLIHPSIGKLIWVCSKT